MSRRVTYFNSSFTTAFHPLDLAGSQLYYAKNTATPSLWNDQSPNAFDLTQTVAAQQPTIGTDTVDFDGVNDFMNRSVVNPFISDNLGTIYFSVNFVAGEVQRTIIINDPTFTSSRNSFQIIILPTGVIRVLLANSSDTIRNIFDTINILSVGYNYIKLTTNGSSYTVEINGVSTSLSFSTGTNNGAWLNDINTTNIRMALNETVTTFLYGKNKTNKIYYNNTSLSPTNLTKLNTFFADPNKY